MEKIKIKNSSQVSEIGYDEEKKVFEVTYKSTGGTYEYYDVQKELWEQAKAVIATGDSIGKFVNGHIKKVFKYHLIQY